MQKELGDFLEDTISAINFYKEDIIKNEGLKRVVITLLEALQIEESKERNKNITKLTKK